MQKFPEAAPEKDAVTTHTVTPKPGPESRHLLHELQQLVRELTEEAASTEDERS